MSYKGDGRLPKGVVVQRFGESLILWCYWPRKVDNRFQSSIWLWRLYKSLMWALEHRENWQWFGVVKLVSVGQGSEATVLLGSMEGWLNSAGGGGRTFPKLGHLTLKDCSPQALEWVSCSIAQWENTGPWVDQDNWANVLLFLLYLLSPSCLQGFHYFRAGCFSHFSLQHLACSGPVFSWKL